MQSPTFAAGDFFMIQQLVARYLFQHDTCPLPGLGTLNIVHGVAQNDFVNKTIMAPVPAIQFTNKETDATTLLDFIAAKTNVSIVEAATMLGNFCNRLKDDTEMGNAAMLDGVGKFAATSPGNLHFEQASLPFSFLPNVVAERVIHPEADHHILVGDKETTAHAMADYYSEDQPQRSRWWIWAIVLGLIGIGLLILYMVNNGFASSFGNSISI
jgi:hypothetical protein